MDTSIADWLIFAWARDIVVVLQVGLRREDVVGCVRRARQVTGAMLVVGFFRAPLLDWEDASKANVFLPTVIWAGLACVASSLASQFLLTASVKKADFDVELCLAHTEAPNDTGSTLYSGSLTFFQTLGVLKPYFWPSTGEWKEVLINRTRACSTWLFVILSKVTNLVSPIYLAQATNALASALKRSSDPQVITAEIWRPLVIYATLIFLSKAFKEGQSLVYIKVQQEAYIEIADKTFAHLHGLSLDWHLRKQTGDVIRSMDRGIAAAQQTMQYVFLYLVPTLVEAAAVTLIFVYHFNNTRLALFVGVNLYIYIYITIKVTLWRKQFRAASAKHDSNLHGRLNDSLVNYETVKYFTAEDYERREYRSLVQKFQQTSMATQVSLSFLNVLQQIIVNFALCGGMILATSRVLAEHGDIGEFVAVNAYIISVFTPLNFLGTIYNMVVNAIEDMKSFGQLLAETAEVQDKPDARDLDVTETIVTGTEVAPMVEFRNVSFFYDKQPLGSSINEISFKLYRGKSMALVGTTGAGKTTITRLLFRFYDVKAGEVLVNGQDVRNVTQRSLRAQIGMVPQDVVLFNSTIAHNLKYGKVDSASQEDIEKAASDAQLDVFINKQEKTYETLVGERGLKLSGGEKQRVAIARCLVKDPPIVVLDEATSALDSQTEQRIQQALNVLSASRTVIAIAHRLSTVKDFDQICVLESGRIIEQGTHDELLANPGSKYSAMWNRQAAGLVDEEPSSPEAQPSEETACKAVSASGSSAASHWDRIAAETRTALGSLAKA